MATKFLEPGGDATFTAEPAATDGFWATFGGTKPTIVTDFVHGSHIKSIKYGVNVQSSLATANGSCADTGTRFSQYIYLNALPSATSTIETFFTAGGVNFVFRLRLTSTGVLQLFETTNQIGTNGATLVTGRWYRISIAYTVTSTTVNRFELFVDGVSSISVTNATLTNTGSSAVTIGNNSANLTLDMRSSDHYIDDSASLTDTGDIWVTAKRPNANGTTNGFTTQIGSSGSGYGTGHSPQVNERTLSLTNGWSIAGAGSAITEEYNIESAATGDINLTGATIVDYMGWADFGSTLAETAQIIVNGVSSNVSLPAGGSSIYTKAAGSTVYPAGTGADIGVITAITVTTVNLYECGILVAFIPGSASALYSMLPLLGVG